MLPFVPVDRFIQTTVFLPELQPQLLPQLLPPLLPQLLQQLLPQLTSRVSTAQVREYYVSADRQTESN